MLNTNLDMDKHVLWICLLDLMVPYAAESLLIKWEILTFMGLREFSKQQTSVCKNGILVCRKVVVPYNHYGHWGFSSNSATLNFYLKK